MNWLSKVYRNIKSWRLPKWLSAFLGIVQDILVEAVKQVTAEGMIYLEKLILQEAVKDISGKEKLENVFKSARNAFTRITITDSMLNLLIETILSKLKKTGKIS